MIKEARDQFNREFSAAKYQEVLDIIQAEFNTLPQFRVAESPVFISREFEERCIKAGEEIVDFLVSDQFVKFAERGLEHHVNVPGETKHTAFIQMDFGVCEEDGKIVPKLIEVQGFPSLYAYQIFISSAFRKVYPFLQDYRDLFGNFTRHSYLDMVRKTILEDENPKQVVLIDYKPKSQHTFVDFLATEKLFGIPIVCITEVIRESKKLYYIDQNGKKIKIVKILNRVIFDELLTKDLSSLQFSLREEVDVKWAGHPNWFFKISKYLLPHLKGTWLPKSYFLDQLSEYPDDLENYILKPLYSYSGTGIVFDISKKDLDEVKEPHDFILQEKVEYAPVIKSPNEPVKVEVRFMYVWPPDFQRPVLVNNVARMSKGKMIGVKYNRDKDWVGGSLCFFEKT